MIKVGQVSSGSPAITLPNYLFKVVEIRIGFITSPKFGIGKSLYSEKHCKMRMSNFTKKFHEGFCFTCTDH